MSDPRVFYSPREDATPEGELTALAAVCRYLLRDRHGAKEATGADSVNEPECKQAGEPHKTPPAGDEGSACMHTRQ
jgi:hypothetical protein